MKRLTDIVLSMTALVLLAPVLLLAAFAVLAGSGLADASRAGNSLRLAPWGGAYFRQG